MLPNVDSKPVFAKAFAEARRNLGVTQLQLSEMTNIGLKSISRYERAKALPKAETLEVLNEVLFNSDGAPEVEPPKVALADASIESIVEELKSRGFKQVTLSAG